MTISPGTKLGPYEVRSLLGEGGMGQVFRARDTRLQRDVAIKVLPQSFSRDADRLRRFEQESRAVAALNHANLLIVFDSGTMPLPGGSADETVPYLVSELLEGSTLRDRMHAGRIPERKVLDYATQIARGLAAAHEHGIIHRDIKPENIFITTDGRAKILDFGLAKLVQAGTAISNETVIETHVQGTRPDMVLGTAGYMAPEQLRGQQVDARADIFSFGAVLYEMLSGHRAFRGDSGADVMSAILHQEPPDLVEQQINVSPALDHIVRRCLEKDPGQRFQSAGDLAFALQELSGARTSSSGSGVMKRPDIAGRGLSRWLVPAAVAAAFVIAVGATWFITRRTSRPVPPKFSQLTYQQGFVRYARFLADGHTFITASRWGFEPEFGLHVGSLDTPGLRSLDTPAQELASVSSKDDILLLNKLTSIGPGYVEAGTLYLMHYGGGAPRPILENVHYADWDPAGEKFAVVRFNPQKHVHTLEYPVGTVLYQTEGWISNPRFSRDGQRIAFLDHPLFGDDLGSVAYTDLQGKVKKFGKVFGSVQNVAWSPDSSEIWFSASDSGVARTIWAVDMSGHHRQLLNAPGTMDIEDVLPNGKVIVSNLSERRVQMIVTPEFPQARDFTWMDWAYMNRFSADGKFLLFGDQHSQSYGAFLRNVDGTPAVRLGDGDPFDLSPDGKLAVSRLPTADEQLELLPTDAGEPHQLTHSNIQFSSARFVTNDRLMGYGNEPGHRPRAFSIDLNGNMKPMTAEGVRVYAFTTDGKRMLIGGHDESDHSVGQNHGNLTGLRVMDVDGGTVAPVLGAEPKDLPLDFNTDGTIIYVEQVLGATRAELIGLEWATGKRTLLHDVVAPGIPAISNGLGATISRDGKSYAYQYHPALSTEYLVEGLR